MQQTEYCFIPMVRSVFEHSGNTFRTVDSDVKWPFGFFKDGRIFIFRKMGCLALWGLWAICLSLLHWKSCLYIYCMCSFLWQVHWCLFRWNTQESEMIFAPAKRQITNITSSHSSWSLCFWLSSLCCRFSRTWMRGVFPVLGKASIQLLTTRSTCFLGNECCVTFEAGIGVCITSVLLQQSIELRKEGGTLDTVQKSSLMSWNKLHRIHLSH